jgi:exodeoxyribonuclease III
VVSLNVNSLHAAIAKRGLMEYIEKDQADVYAFQEVMAAEKSTKWRIDAAMAMFRVWGYHAYWHAGQRNNAGYGGTMVLTKVVPTHVVRGTGNPSVDVEGRFMALVFDDLLLVNTYVPTLGMDLSGKDKKSHFWKQVVAKHGRLAQRYQVPTMWVGDMNVAPEECDTDATGIRQQLVGSRIYKKLGKELPASSAAERAEYGAVKRSLRLRDVFATLEAASGYQAPDRERYTQYSHGSRELGIGQRIDHALTNLPIGAATRGDVELRVVECTVRSDAFVSDHLPLESTLQHGHSEPTTHSSEAGVSSDRSALWMKGTRVLVHRDALRNMACSHHQEWIPATVDEVIGPIMRVQLDRQWARRPGERYRGVTVTGVKEMGVCPSRWRPGDEVVHYRTKKPGTVVEVTSHGGLTASAH